MNQLIIESVTFRNFMSYGNNDTTVSFTNSNAYMIVGEDLDNTANGKVSNGTGKTTIFNAVVYGLFDRIIENDVNKDDLVNNVNKRDMCVSVEFTSPNGNKYCVTRSRKTKAGAAGNTVQLFENGVDISLDSSGTNALIVAAIGMPFELFIRIVVIPATKTPFLDLPLRSTTSANQTAVLEELFNITVLTARAKGLKANISATEQAIRAEELALALKQKDIDLFHREIASMKARADRWNVTTGAQIEILKSHLSAAEHVDVDQQYQLSQQILSDEAMLVQLSQQLTRETTALKADVATFRQHGRDLAELENHKCPYCKQAYESSDGEKLQHHEAITQLEHDILDRQATISDLKARISDLATTVADNKTKVTVSDIDTLMKIQKDRDALALHLQQLLTEVNPYVSELQTLEAEGCPITIDYGTLNDLKRTLDHQNILLKLLTKNNSFVRKAILDRYLPHLNERLEYYLTQLGLRYKVVFQADMSASITILNRSISFGLLSAGQKARVNLAISFAFRSVSTKFGCPVNICMLDETLDVGLDAIGVQAAARMLKREATTLSSCLYVISHREELAHLFDHQIRVEFQAGFSRIAAQ